MDVSEVMVIDYKKWMTAMGYADSTVYTSTNYVRDFLLWLRTTPAKDRDKISRSVTANYLKHLRNRKKKRQAGYLSDNSIINQFTALRRFDHYLRQSGRGSIEIDLRLKASPSQERYILSIDQIKAMYRASEQLRNDKHGLLGLRDRAILGVYYGCGLRRSEGIALNTTDVQLKEKLLYVRKGKNYRERYVPISPSVSSDLKNYITIARKRIPDSATSCQALFLGIKGLRLGGTQVLRRVQMLAMAAGIEHDTGLHTLRHSIATHLLQSGMTLEEVSAFLGHRTLQSTQIYTHI